MARFRRRIMGEARHVREFIQLNYQPYQGDGQFLSGATERTFAQQ
jgi:pyruvate-formate lyase